jgi:hypothetical protein
VRDPLLDASENRDRAAELVSRRDPASEPAWFGLRVSRWHGVYIIPGNGALYASVRSFGERHACD